MPIITKMETASAPRVRVPVSLANTRAPRALRTPIDRARVVRPSRTAKAALPALATATRYAEAAVLRVTTSSTALPTAARSAPPRQTATLRIPSAQRRATKPAPLVSRATGMMAALASPARSVAPRANMKALCAARARTGSVQIVTPIAPPVPTAPRTARAARTATISTPNRTAASLAPSASRVRSRTVLALPPPMRRAAVAPPEHTRVRRARRPVPHARTTATMATPAQPTVAIRCRGARTCRLATWRWAVTWRYPASTGDLRLARVDAVMEERASRAMLSSSC